MGVVWVAAGSVGRASVTGRGFRPEGWLTALALTCFVLGLLVTAIQSVFPQEPVHRLAWWRARWNHQHRRGTPPPQPGDEGDSAVAVALCCTFGRA